MGEQDRGGKVGQADQADQNDLQKTAAERLLRDDVWKS